MRVLVSVALGMFLCSQLLFVNRSWKTGSGFLYGRIRNKRTGARTLQLYFYIFKQKCVSWSLWPLEYSCVVLFCLLTEAEKPEPDFCIVVSGTKRTGAGTLQLVFREQNWPFFPFLQWKSSASSSSRTQHRMKTSWAWKKVKLSPLSPGRNISPMNIKHRKNVDQVVHFSA